ncbi:MAG: UDP-N-acetylmuramoyl-L-alanyl-D-glutamate--2,6-diaminopimelate ligase, partial [Myxococcales bacterium]|nr:UDP-N-acetylmuramoyl-L-alanyl-D-glutamate--2,6-diaminopimelate ligase [Myxococcales bacterium]
TRRWFSVPSRGEAVHAADLEARAVEVSREGTTITLAPSPLAEALGGALELQMIGEIFAENALAAAAATLAAGVPGEAVARGLASCPRSRGRFELLARRPTVAVDYAHTPDALARTCDTARRLAGDRAVIMVFGAGGDTDPGKRAPMGEAAGSRADLVILTTDNARGEDPAAIAAALEVGCRRGGRARVVIELDRARAIERALAEAGEDDVIVIAGKGHEEGQTIAGVTAAFSDHEVVATLLGAAPRERST